MSEEETQLTDEANQEGLVNISVSDSSVKYDTNMTLQDMVFWLEAVKNMAIYESMAGPEEGQES